MQLLKRHFKQHGNAVIATFLAGLVLLLGAMAACPALHELIHHDADSAEHHCPVTMFAHGQVDLSPVEISVTTPATGVDVAPQASFSIFVPTIENLPAGRAPPVSTAAS